MRAESAEYQHEGRRYVGHLALRDGDDSGDRSPRGRGQHHGGDGRMNGYGRPVHSFTNQRADDLGFPGIASHGPTDARSWRATLDLSDQVLS
jgi:hypothetical protein